MHAGDGAGNGAGEDEGDGAGTGDGAGAGADACDGAIGACSGKRSAAVNIKNRRKAKARIESGLCLRKHS